MASSEEEEEDEERRKKLFKSRCKALARVVDATLGVFLTSLFFLVTALLGKRWACVDRDRDESGWLADDEFGRRFNCGPGKVHEVASLWLGTREKAIKKILEAHNGEDFSCRSLVVSGVLTLVTLGLSFGSALPGGLFLPLIYCGACLGSASARFPLIVSSPLRITRRHSALLGAVALLAGVQRSTVSLCVIMLEGTGNTQLLIPIIVVVCVARFVGNLTGVEGLYELSMELQRVPFLPKHVARSLDLKTVKDFLESRENAAPLATLPLRPTAEQAARVIVTSQHGAYPVVSDDVDADDDGFNSSSSNNPEKKLVGLILREHVKALLCASAYAARYGEANQPPGLARCLARACYDTGTSSSSRKAEHPALVAEDVSRAPSIDVAGAYVPDVERGLFLEEEAKVPFFPGGARPHFKKKHRRRLLDLAPAMVRSPYVVYEDCPVSRAYRLFVSMGARHLLVISHEGFLVGILTRHDMFHASQANHSHHA